MSYAIHWFRRDLRVAGNPALQQQFKDYQGRVVGLFCFDHSFLARDDFSINRFQFFLETLACLRQELQEIGSDLLVLDIGPKHAFEELFHILQKTEHGLPQSVSWNRDYEPFAVKRDQSMQEHLHGLGIDVRTERDHLLIEPSELEKSSGGGYQVFSPFCRAWLKKFSSPEVQQRLQQQKKALAYFETRLAKKAKKIFCLTWSEILGKKQALQDQLDPYRKRNLKDVSVPIPKAGSLAAYQQLQKFSERIDRYHEERDIPAIEATSGLSIYLKNGSISISQLIAYLDLEAFATKGSGRDHFLNELIWREFYYHILARHPRVEGEAFLTRYKHLQWDNRQDWFEAWKAGRTGYPIVDAGMRQLAQTGWMHNRVRMIVASFLTKHLLIDWRWGEKYFMKTLLDGDLAANNGGWQWAASTGCDPQPYFRIFNPWLQSKKFDPEGHYIKHYVPELESVAAKSLHEPIVDHPTYPKPIVEHAVRRDLALARYKQL